MFSTRTRSWSRFAIALATASILTVAACSSDKPAVSHPTKAATSAPTTASTSGPATPPRDRVVVFGGDGNNLDAYAGASPFRHQRVNAAYTPEAPQRPNPHGTDINAQICFFPDHSGRFIAGEDKNQSKGDRQGWGIFTLSGKAVGSFRMRETAKLVPTYQASKDNAENYGCGVLSDGRVVTTDVGDQAAGVPDGQLIVWFPPFDSHHVKYCKLDVAISTAQSVLVDRHDHLLVAAARPTSVPGATGAGVWEYSPPFPTGPDASHGCGRTDATGAPQADRVVKRRLIAPGQHALVTPAGIVAPPTGGLYVSSVFSGVINEYDRRGRFVRTILQPPAGERLGAKPFSTGTPLGMGVAPDGTLYYADIGVVVDPKNGIGPGSKTGTERRIAFHAGVPDPPQTMARGLDYPDGIGVFVPRD